TVIESESALESNHGMLFAALGPACRPVPVESDVPASVPVGSVRGVADAAPWDPIQFESWDEDGVQVVGEKPLVLDESGHPAALVWDPAPGLIDYWESPEGLHVGTWHFVGWDGHRSGFDVPFDIGDWGADDAFALGGIAGQTYELT